VLNEVRVSSEANEFHEFHAAMHAWWKEENEDLKLFWHAWGIGYWIRYFILRKGDLLCQ